MIGFPVEKGMFRSRSENSGSDFIQAGHECVGRVPRARQMNMFCMRRDLSVGRT